MPNPESYQQALERMRDADEARRKAFREIGSWRSGDQEGVAKAKRLLEEFKVEEKVLQERYIAPLERRLSAGDPSAIDELIDVLSIDVPSYRSGYRKESYYRHLKKHALSNEQVSRLRKIALQRCESTEYRREDRDLRKLMVKLANVEFLEKVAEIPAKPGSLVESQKTRMMQVILHGRKDLRKPLRLLQESKL